MSAFDRLHPAVQHHIVNSLGWRGLRPLQEAAIEPLEAGGHAILLAPTAGGKTEAAFFPLLSRMLRESWSGLGLLYVCPLKALLNNLAPRLGTYARLVGRRVELWHGDVAAGAKRLIRREPPDVLLTTPESIEVMLTGRRYEPARFFADVRAVVVDELHAFAGDDRGWHLLSVLERVSRMAGRPLQRVGLSATVGNPEQLLEWLVGSAPGPRHVLAPPAASPPPPELELDYVGTLENAARVISRLHVGEKRLVFVDSRSRVEDLTHALREEGVETFVSHSSLSLDERHRAETAFSEGRNCVIVATSTLELGIDVGDLDRVIQIEAPASVASFLQRLGRTGRRAGTRRSCLFLATRDHGLVRAAGLLRLFAEGYVEPVEPPVEPLHVFAQQILALTLQEGGLGRSQWPRWIGGMPAFRSAEAAELEAIVDFMLDQRILFDEGGILSIGPEGERSFGFKHFMELFSVFTDPPVFTILHGRQEIGQIDPASFQLQQEGRIVLLLGGRSWHLQHVDWKRRVAYVVPSAERGHSRWIGPGQPLGFRLCRAIRSVLTGGEVPARLTRRAEMQLDEIRQRFAFLDDERTVLAHEKGGQTHWWTFAGLRANAALGSALGPLRAENSEDANLAIRLQPGTDLATLRAALARATSQPDAEMLPDVIQDALDGLKFSTCLPERLAKRLAARRLSDPAGTKAVQGEPVGEVAVG